MNLAYAGGPFAAAVSYQTEKVNGNATTGKYTQVNGSYDFGIVKLLAAYGRVKDVVPTVNKTNEYQIGLDFPVNSVFTISGGYAHSKDDNNVGGDTTRKGFGLAGLYALSKRTNLYAGLNTSKGEFPAGTPDLKIRTYAAGVRHTF